MKQYNEQDVLKAIAGSYQPGFLQIKLTHSFDGGLGRFSQKDLGTFLHEYVHFLQNISTPYGIFEASTYNEAAVETFIDIEPKDEGLRTIEYSYDNGTTWTTANTRMFTEYSEITILTRNAILMNSNPTQAKIRIDKE